MYKYSNTIFVEFENKIFIPLIRYLINVRAKNIRTSNSNHELINRIFFKLYNVNLTGFKIIVSKKILFSDLDDFLIYCH